MKSLLIALSIAAQTGLTDNQCENIAGLAGDIMENRQGGVSLSDTMDAATSNVDNPQVAELYRQIVIQAYSQSRFSLPQYQEKVVQRFRNEWHVGCLKAQ